MEITINGKTVTPKYGFKSMMLYEKIMNKPFEPKTMQDMIVFFYCTCMAADKDLTIDLDAFIEILDNDPSKFSEFSEWAIGQIIRQNNLMTPQEPDQTVVKEAKKTAKKKGPQKS